MPASLIKFLRCYSALYMRTCRLTAASTFTGKQSTVLNTSDSARFFSTRRDNKTNPLPATLKDTSKSSKQESSVNENERNGKQKRLKTRKDYFDNAIDEWFDRLVENSKCSTVVIDWENEAKGHAPNWPFCVFSKLIETKRPINGIYEISTLLIDFIESKIKDGTYPNKKFEMQKLVGLVSLSVHQKSDHKAAFDRYQEILSAATEDGELILDGSTCNTLIDALWKTKHWKECLKLLEVSKISRIPSQATLSNVLAAAFRENDHRVAQDMLDALEAIDFQPDLTSYEALVRYRPISHVVKILKDYRWILSEEAADLFMEHYEKKCRVNKVSLDKRSCPCCGNSIEPSRKISDPEMKALVEKFKSQVFVRDKDIFINSDPEEMDRFKRFMASCPKHDVVVDGMNVMMATGQGKTDLLTKTISYFSEMGKRVLVISKSHTEKQLKSIVRSFDRPERPVDWFFSKDKSQDDLFLIYAALHGNEGCLVVSRDQLRDHRYLLGSEMALVFKRWQQKHQVIFRVDGVNPSRLRYKWPPTLEVVAQTCKDGTVHVPYLDVSRRDESFTYSNSWLCIKNSDGSPEKGADKKLNG